MTTSSDIKSSGNRPTYVGLPETLHDAVTEIATARHCAVADVIREAVILYLASPDARRGVA